MSGNRNRMGRMGLDGDCLMPSQHPDEEISNDWIRSQAAKAVEETDLWPAETANNVQHIAGRDRIIFWLGAGIVAFNAILILAFVAAACWARAHN